MQSNERDPNLVKRNSSDKHQTIPATASGNFDSGSDLEVSVTYTTTPLHSRTPPPPATATSHPNSSNMTETMSTAGSYLGGWGNSHALHQLSRPHGQGYLYNSRHLQASSPHMLSSATTLTSHLEMQQPNTSQPNSLPWGYGQQQVPVYPHHTLQQDSPKQLMDCSTYYPTRQMGPAAYHTSNVSSMLPAAALTQSTAMRQTTDPNIAVPNTSHQMSPNHPMLHVMASSDPRTRMSCASNVVNTMYQPLPDMSVHQPQYRNGYHGASLSSPSPPLADSYLQQRQLLASTLGWNRSATQQQALVPSPQTHIQHRAQPESGSRHHMPMSSGSSTGSGNSRVYRPKKPCKEDGCHTQARLGGYCIKHGGGKRCIALDCPKLARFTGSLCKTHKEIQDEGRKFAVKTWEDSLVVNRELANGSKASVVGKSRERTAKTAVATTAPSVQAASQDSVVQQNPTGSEPQQTEDSGKMALQDTTVKVDQIDNSELELPRNTVRHVTEGDVTPIHQSRESSSDSVSAAKRNQCDCNTEQQALKKRKADHIDLVPLPS